MTLAVRARRVVLPDGVRAATVHSAGGRITAVTGFADAPDGVVTLADDEVLLPGLVDSHVHVDEPGRTEWEGSESATRAAAAGGVATLVDMPLDSVPPTVDLKALQVKRQAAEGRVAVDVAFWGGAVPGNTSRLPRLPGKGRSPSAGTPTWWPTRPTSGGPWPSCCTASRSRPMRGAG